MPPDPARVHIILARKADTAIIIRRGPSKSVCTIGWNLRNDTFQLGQWLKGRIYERRCDLSPDGKHFIYFVYKGKSSVGDSFTAISKTPYLKAIGLWQNGSAWNGGGLFISDHTFWLNRFYICHIEHLSPKGFKQQIEHPFKENYGGECPGVYYIRLQRDGWTLLRSAPISEDRSTNLNDILAGVDHFTIFNKPLWNGWTLEKTAHVTIKRARGKSTYFDTHRLLHPDKPAIDLPDWEWADAHKRRILYVKAGILFEGTLNKDGLTSEKPLRDFNDMTFQALKAPYAGFDKH
jgi:hypothetical protein